MKKNSVEVCVNTGVAPVELGVPVVVAPVVRVTSDGSLVSCQRQVEIENTLTGLIAIGMTRWNAIVSMIEGGFAVQADFNELDGIPPKLICSYGDFGAAVEVFEKIAKKDKILANMLFNFSFEGFRVEGNLNLGSRNWIITLPAGLKVDGYLMGCTALKTLPAGLKVDGYLDLMGCTALKTLPAGLKVGGYLDLMGCTALTSLQAGLSVGMDLYLNGCTAWDGTIPVDAIVVGKVVTNKHKNGISLPVWRKLHPNGEKS